MHAPTLSGRPVVTRTVVVSGQYGLHMRVCSAIAGTIGRYQAHVIVQHGNQLANAASILALLSLAVMQGTELVLSATGADAEEALDAVLPLFAD